MNKHIVITASLIATSALAVFFGYQALAFKHQNSDLTAQVASLEASAAKIQEQTKVPCQDVLVRDQQTEVYGYKLFVQCNFVSGKYGDTDTKNVFGIKNAKTGKMYIIGSKSGIFDQNKILTVIDDRYVFLVNSYEGEGRYIMVDTSEAWPTDQQLTYTVYPKTVDQYIRAGLIYDQITKKF